MSQQGRRRSRAPCVLAQANHGTHCLRSKSRADHSSVLGLLVANVRDTRRRQWAHERSPGTYRQHLRLEIAISLPRDAPDDPRSLAALGKELADDVRAALRWGEADLEYRHIGSATAVDGGGRPLSSARGTRPLADSSLGAREHRATDS